MLTLIIFSFFSGIITILSPCILPVLPVVLAGSTGTGRARPFGIIVGFTVCFTFFALMLSTIVRVLGIPADLMRYIAIVIIFTFGIIMLVPGLKNVFSTFTAKLANQSTRGTQNTATTSRWKGFWSGTLVGASLGLVWTPCVGPIMASVLSLALTQNVSGGAAIIATSYAIGTAIPMLAIMLGGRALLTKLPFLSKNTGGIQKAMGVLMLVVALAIGLGWDRQFQLFVLQLFPQYGSGLAGIENTKEVRNALKKQFDQKRPMNSGKNNGQQSRGTLPPGITPVSVTSNTGENTSSSLDATTVQFQGSFEDSESGVTGNFGLAPPLIAKGPWLNSEPLTMDKLKGKVVIIDFWTYSCINCLRTLPYLQSWYQRYKDAGLVIIGVHSPEFEFEKSLKNVQNAVKSLKVTWPVVQDNDFSQWRSYKNRFWPSKYFIDAKGNVRYIHYGEGDYAISEEIIRKLLQEAGNITAADTSRMMIKSNKTMESDNMDLSGITPEIYLGAARSAHFANDQPLEAGKQKSFVATKQLVTSSWTLKGDWYTDGQFIESRDGGELELKFIAKNLFLVVESMEKNSSVNVFIDGKQAKNTIDVKGGKIKPMESRLYELAKFANKEEHLLTLSAKGKLRFYTFTFG